MALKKRTTRSTPATTTTTPPVTNAQLKALIDQGIADALAARDADRSMNDDDSHNSGTGVRRNERVVHETVGHDVAYAMTWTNLKKKMTDKYCPRGEIKKLEVELMFSEESDKIERYVGGLPDMIHGSVVASKPKTMQEAMEMENELMDKKIRTFAERQTKNKRKQDDNNNQAQQQPPKKQGVAIAYTVGPRERKKYAGTLPLFNKCKFHHNGQCTVKCANCNKVSHLTRDCRSPAATNNQRNPTCYECGNQRHYRSDCPKLKNQNYGNQAGGTGACGMVHALGRGEINQNLNNMEDDINA
ncbi:RNA-directed DNA polymerase, eukaryota [Tanacetum coccineum]